MTKGHRLSVLAILFLVGIVAASNYHDDQDHKPEIVHQWDIVEYEWPDVSVKEKEKRNGNYIPANSEINGIRVFKKQIYVTILRVKPGVPCTLGVVVKNTNKRMAAVDHVIRPFPDWDMQKLGDCDALQRVQGMEIDPQTGYMWIVDTGYMKRTEGRGGLVLDPCPAKIIIFDIENNREVHRYKFPAKVVGNGLFFLSDVVLQYQGGKARYAYISDTLGYKLVVYDHKEDVSYAFSHPSMRADPVYKNMTVSNMTITGIEIGIKGIGMSPDFKYLYYSSVAGIGLHQIETSVLRNTRGNDNAFARSVRSVGKKVCPGDGMAYGARNNLYFSAVELSSIRKWDVKKDLNINKDYGAVEMLTQASLTADKRMEWPDTLALDDCGYLWFTTSGLQKFNSMRKQKSLIWRIYVDDYNYLDSRFHSTDNAESFHKLPLQVMVASLVALFWLRI